MAPKSSKRSLFSTLLLILGLIILATAAILVGYRLISGQSLGILGFIRYQKFVLERAGEAINGSKQVKATSSGEFNNIIFLHHSVGKNFIEQGSLRELLSQQGYSFWDQGYNPEGLRDPHGEQAAFYYFVPNDNTDPDGLNVVFNQQAFSAPINALSGLLQHEVIMVKSCYPVSNISDAAQMERYKQYYSEISNTMGRHPDKLFLVLTTPPMNPAGTTTEAAGYAREMANWIMSEEFNKGHTNIRTFDLFDALAEDDPTQPDYNMLRADYRSGDDSHPTAAGNQIIGQAIFEFIDQSIIEYRKIYSSKEGGEK